MYQGYGRTEALPIAMVGPRQCSPRMCPVRAVAYLARGQQARAAGEIVGKCEGQMLGLWVKTVDVGRLDANGCLCMLARADDMVMSGGFNIVIEVSVFAEASVTEKELVELCARHKIRRKELREPFLVGRERSVAGD